MLAAASSALSTALGMSPHMSGVEFMGNPPGF